MPERANVFETIGWGVESLAAPGVVVAANKHLEAIGVVAKPKVATTRFRPPGAKHDTAVIPGNDMTDLTASGKLDYSNIVYPLSSVVNSGTIATLGTNGRTWTFISQTYAPDVSQTYTLDLGSSVRGGRVALAQFTELAFAFKRDSADLSGTLIGQQYQDPINVTGNAIFTITKSGTVSGGTYTITYGGQTTGLIQWNATAAAVQVALQSLSSIGPGNIVVTGGPVSTTALTLTFTGALGYQVISAPTKDDTLLTGGGTLVVATSQAGSTITTVTALPVTPAAISIKADTTSGGLGTTTLTRVLQADLKIGARYAPLWALNAANASYAAVVETAPDITLKLKLEADGAGMAYLAAMRNASLPTYYFQIDATGPAMPAPDAGQNYKFTFQMAAKVESMDDLADAGGVEAADFTFRAVNDGAWGNGKAYQFVIQNQVTAL